jgi:uncharacterized phage-associated protein
MSFLLTDVTKRNRLFKKAIRGYSVKKTKQLLAYLIQSNPCISITSLMKLSYLVDLLSTKERNKKISGFEYKRYKYGPFDEKIYANLNYLKDKKIICEDAAISETGDEFIVYKPLTSTPLEQITEDEKKIIDKVVKSLKGYGSRALTELTYRTAPMKRIGAEIGNEKGINQRLDLKAN